MAALWRHVAMGLLVVITVATAIILGEAYWGRMDRTDIPVVQLPHVSRVVPALATPAPAGPPAAPTPAPARPVANLGPPAAPSPRPDISRPSHRSALVPAPAAPRIVLPAPGIAHAALQAAGVNPLLARTGVAQAARVARVTQAARLARAIPASHGRPAARAAARAIGAVRAAAIHPHPPLHPAKRALSTRPGTRVSGAR